MRVSLVSLAAVFVALFVGSMLVHADAAPSVTTSIRNAGGTTLSTSVIGSSVVGAVSVASSTASTTPTGSVDFALYPNTSCSGSPTSTQTAVALIAGSATSSSSIVPATGLSYKVHYSGDANNILANGSCVALTATSGNVTISTSLSTTTPVIPGTFVQGSSVLANATANAAGTVSYNVYTNNSCSSGAQSAGSFTVVNGVVPNSNSLQFNSVGAYYWQAVYSGDANNVAATSTCGTSILNVANPASNIVSITTSLSTTTALVGTAVFDGAILNGKTANAGGTVTYSVYTNNACSLGKINAGQKTVTNGNIPNSDSVGLNSVGTYYWQVVYSGDVSNVAATSTCGAEVVTISAALPPPTQNGNGSILGQVFNDLNKNGIKDAGEAGLPGWSINLYASANFVNGAYDPVFKTTVSDSSGNYSFSSLADGTYSVEELRQSGWKQTTDDFSSVVVSGGASVTSWDFGDVKKGNAGHGQDKHGHGKGKNIEDEDGLESSGHAGRQNDKNKDCKEEIDD